MSAADITEERAHLVALYRVAIPAIATLPPEQRIDPYLGLAVAMAGSDEPRSLAARAAANALQEVTSSQLLLEALLK